MSSKDDISICPACGSEFQIIYYQRRAADEPPDKITFCKNCPVDTRKLSINYPEEVKQHRNSTATRPILHRRTSSSTDLNSKQRTVFPTWSLEKKGYRLCIKVEGSAASRCYRQTVREKRVFRPLITSTVPIQIGQQKELVQVYKNLNLEGEGHIVENSSRIAPLVTLQQVSVRIQKAIVSAYSTKLVSGYETMLENMEYAELTLLRTLQEGKEPCILIFLPLCKEIDISMQNSCLGILQQSLARYGTENTVKSFMSSQMINTLFAQSSKGYDWPSAPSIGYVYAWKPDGERFWYVKYGSIWLFCRRLLSGRISGWTVCDILSTAEHIANVIDVEVMIGFPNIMLDLLVDDSGKPMPSSRTLDIVLEEIKYSKEIDVPLEIREYHNSQEELLATKDQIKYPTDGIVGIQDGSMTMIKLKSTKSIELKLIENGDLLSSEDIVVVTSNLQHTYPIGSIIEVRFNKDSNTENPVITKTLLRTDKTKANDYEVCQNIMNIISSVPDSLARRNAVQWCNAIRQKINQIASKSTGKGRVIMDIGAGDGQAISDYSTDPNITYLLIEPDKVKCHKLIRRLKEPDKKGRSALYEGAEHVTKVVGQLSIKSLKYAVICCTIRDVLNQEYSTRTLRGAVRYCVASFSISHMVSELRELALSGIDVIGCGYMYDIVDRSGVLVNDSGVKMKIGMDGKANVKWGGDKIYKERAIKLKDFQDVFHTRLGKSLVPVFTGEEFSLLESISNKVYVVSTKKHI